MIIVRLQGGMGNQMFQYALGRALSVKYNVPLGLDLAFLLDRTPIFNYSHREYELDKFNIKANIILEDQVPFLYRKHNLGVLMRYIDFIRRRIVNTPGKEKKNYYFDENIFNIGPDAYLEGWWQSYKYFKDIEDTIRNDFSFKKPFRPAIEELSKAIKNENSVCIHIRRGDYVNNKKHEVVSDKYYKKGISYLEGKIKIDKIYVFSDDIKWCEENLHFNYPVVFIGDSYRGEKSEGHFYLMSSCRYFVIPNSSFSWWAAWLADYKEKIVIVPDRWHNVFKINYNDLIPSDWIRLSL